MRYRWVVLALSFVAQLSNALAAQAVAPLAPIFQPELGLSKAEVGFFSSAAFAGAWSVLLVAGSLTDRFGVRRMMSLGQAVTGSLVLSMSAAGSFIHAAVVMFAAGLGRGATAPGVTKAVMDWFPPSARATAMGVNQAAVPIAGIVTASTLPALGLVLGWRSAIAAVGFAILAGGALTALLYREPKPLPAASLHPAGVRSGLSKVIRNRRLWLVSAMGPLFSGVQLAMVTYLALYFKEVVLVSALPDDSVRVVAAGGFLALSHLGGACSRVLWGMISDRFFQQRRAVAMAATGALSAVMCAVVAIVAAGCPLWLLSIIVFVLGGSALGWGGLYLALAAETAGPKYAGAGVGLAMTSMQLGSVGGPPLFGIVVDLTGSYQAAWLLLSGLCTISVLIATLYARREKPAER